MNTQNKTLKIVLAGLLAALTCVATMIIRIPTFKGYVHIGDCMVIASGIILGPVVGGLAAGIGSMLTDLLAGYTYYVPATLIIKAADAMAAGLIWRAMGRKRGALVASGIVGELIMVFGYFGFTALLLGKGLGAALSIPGDLVQGATGIVLGILLMKVFEHSKVMDKIMK